MYMHLGLADPSDIEQLCLNPVGTTRQHERGVQMQMMQLAQALKLNDLPHIPDACEHL